MQTTYNAFSGSAPASNDNAFQSAIDYLIANRKKPVFNNQGGLFTQGSNKTESKSSVMTDLFGDEYIKRNQGGGESSFEQPFTGNPYASITKPGGLATLQRATDYQKTAASIRNNPLVSTIGGMFLGPLGSVAAKYGAPALFDYLGNRAYQQYGQEMQQIGGELFNPANPNLAALAYNDPNYDAYRSDFPAGGVTYAPGSPATFYNDPNYDAFRSDANVVVGGPINTSLLQGTSIYGGDPGVGIDSGNFDSGGGGGGWSDAGGGVVGSTDTGYDGNW